MAHPNLLRDVLREDQEPFQLHHYIADKHCINLYKPTFHQTSSLNLNLCTKSCFKPPLFHSARKRPSKPRTRAINIGFCSYLKRLWDKNKARKSSDKLEVNSEDARLSTVGWSESNEGKSLDMESSSSSSTYDYADIHSCENKCSSSQPFCFALQRSSYADHTPDFLSPVASPISHDKQHNYDEAESLQKIQVEKEEEEEKNQCSPVSVLAPPFQDDDEQHRGDEEDSEFDTERSYASVQRLRRFQRVAELDPVELEKTMLEDGDEIVVIVEEQLHNHVNYPESFDMEENVNEVVRQVLSRSKQYDENKISSDVRQLLLQLIDEEKKSGPDVVVSRVCKRLNEWKQVKSNTIDMMVELDLRKDVDVWKLYEEEVRDKLAREIESAIFGLLLEELVF
ncbi:uncharacterized protein LOC108206931 [Daucus carota subsp. sativus]|uniref:DUF4378 domain-containing protein n=1 Tax=Daucus carota subsp. sativus TaxID=79200 RepID=A0A166ES17_DAUCS|nr:PREDICTED: uncharacterized protein LOC108206931 [Daucus carota subsp. sativus]